MITETFYSLWLYICWTLSWCGNFKIHRFTGPGTFAVEWVGNAPTNPEGGPANVDYREIVREIENVMELDDFFEIAIEAIKKIWDSNLQGPYKS